MYYLTRSLKKTLFLSFKVMFVFYCGTIVSAYGQLPNNSGSYSIEGRIQNFGDGSLIGTIRDMKDNTFRTDTIMVKNDAFKHSGRINAKQIVTYKATGNKFAKFRKVLKDGDSVTLDFGHEKSSAIDIVVAPGSKIKVSGAARTYLDAYPSGSRENDQLAALNRKTNPIANQLGDLDYTDKNKVAVTRAAEDSLVKVMSEFESDFVKRNPTSIVSSYIIWKKYDLLNKRNPAKADSLFNLISSAEKSIYHQQILQMQQSRAKSLTVAVGDMFPSFNSKMVYKGTAFSLDQTRGKYTLIDFWGTWCIPCIREMPKLNSYFVKYRNKLNLVGVAKDQYQSWKAFLDKHDYGWIQVLDQDIPKLSDQLNVRVYPTKYLLDPSGKVVLIFKDSNDDVWNALDSLLGT